MNNDLISRAALLEEYEWLKANISECSRAEIDEHIERIKRAPVVDAEPVRHGRWYNKKSLDYPHMNEWRCSVCEVIKSVNPIAPKDKYCNDCGAKMDAEA